MSYAFGRKEPSENQKTMEHRLPPTYVPDAPQVTYRMAGNLRRLANGQLVSIVDKMRDIPGKQRKKLRRIKREEQQLLEIEKGME